MRTFQQMIDAHRESADVVTRIGRAGIWHTVNEDGRFSIKIDRAKMYERLDAEAIDFIRTLDEMNFLEQLEIYITGCILATGPKVFRPTVQQLRHLELMDLNLTFEEFNTPFPLVVVEFPDEYAKERVVTTIEGTEDHPHYSVLYHDPKARFICHQIAYGEGARSQGMRTWWSPTNPADHMEKWFRPDEDWNGEFAKAHTTSSDLKVEAKIKRAVLNYCLLLDEVGTKRVGVDNVNEYAQLVKFLQRKTVHSRKNIERRDSLAVIYKPNLEVELVRHVRTDTAAGELTGRKVSPHVRRGHYRMVPFGPMDVVPRPTRRVRIPVCFVNAHLLTEGQVMPTQVYRTPDPLPSEGDNHDRSAPTDRDGSESGPRPGVRRNPGSQAEDGGANLHGHVLCGRDVQQSN